MGSQLTSFSAVLANKPAQCGPVIRAGWTGACFCAHTWGGDLWLSVRQVQSVSYYVPVLCSWSCFAQPIHQYLLKISLQLLVVSISMRMRNVLTFILESLHVIAYITFIFLQSSSKIWDIILYLTGRKLKFRELKYLSHT